MNEKRNADVSVTQSQDIRFARQEGKSLERLSKELERIFQRSLNNAFTSSVPEDKTLTAQDIKIIIAENALEWLRISIKKWALISVGKGIDYGGDNCALCHFYQNKNILVISSRTRFCSSSCPVILYGNGKEQCDNTPYNKWIEHQRSHSLENIKDRISFRTGFRCRCGKCRELANKELMFLQRILEKVKEEIKILKKEKPAKDLIGMEALYYSFISS